jgi:5-methylcytosine-specific restriction protein B
LGEGFCIGHSYFCNLTEATDAALRSIVDYELSPLLREYWYDDRTKANDWIGRLKDAIK